MPIRVTHSCRACAASGCLYQDIGIVGRQILAREIRLTVWPNWEQRDARHVKIAIGLKNRVALRQCLLLVRLQERASAKVAEKEWLIEFLRPLVPSAAHVVGICPVLSVCL